MTIYDIAKKAGVSIATVSRAMNPRTRGRVAASTLKRLDAVVRKYGYTPSSAARNLGGASLKTIGVVLPHFEGIFFSDYYQRVLAGVADGLLPTEYRFKLVMLKPRPGGWDRHDFRASEGVDGVLVTHWPNFFSSKRALERIGAPCTIVNDPEPGVRARFVTGDNREGGRLVARHLADLGHSRVAVITGPSWSGDSRGRLKGFLEAAPPRMKTITLEGGFQLERAEALVERLFDKDRAAVTAVFCLNDHMAIGALKALKKLGLRCPKDVSVAGYDDDARAAHTDPPLTTVRVPVYRMAKDAAASLAAELGGKALREERCRMYPVELVARESTGRPR